MYVTGGGLSGLFKLGVWAFAFLCAVSLVTSLLKSFGNKSELDGFALTVIIFASFGIWREKKKRAKS